MLVSAAALEEGVDVAECGFVVRDTYVATTKTHVQGSGRARRPDSVVYYFENDPYLEQEREKDLKAVAKNEELSMSKTKLASSASFMTGQFTILAHFRLRRPSR